jgi:hypothetical protein
MSSAACAWSDAGHKLVAAIAFRQLSAEQQSTVVAALRQHPRFEIDFQRKLPEELDSPSARSEWYFQQAAIWPDLVRGLPPEAQKEFHHSKWHYIDLPLFITPEDEATMRPDDNVDLVPPTEPNADINVVQAIRLARRKLADPHEPLAAKGVWYCWLFHLVGDLHQPCHSTQLFSLTLFPTGDHGGNLIKLEQRSNMHSLWDQFLGLNVSYREVRNRAISTVAEPENIASGMTAAKALDEAIWLTESHRLAKTAVYDEEILGYLRGYTLENEAPPLQVTERYLQTGGAIAEARVLQAGYRLGAIIKEVLSAEN